MLKFLEPFIFRRRVEVGHAISSMQILLPAKREFVPRVIKKYTLVLGEILGNVISLPAEFLGEIQFNTLKLEPEIMAALQLRSHQQAQSLNPAMH